MTSPSFVPPYLFSFIPFYLGLSFLCLSVFFRCLCLSLSFSLILFPLLLYCSFSSLSFLSLFLHTLPLFVAPHLFSLLPLLTASSPLSTFPSVPFYLGLFFSLSLSVCVLPLLLTPSRLFALCPYPSHPILFLPLAIFQFHYFSFLLFSPTLSITGSSFPLFSRYLFCCTLQPCIFLLTLLNVLLSVFSVFIYLIF